MENIDSIIEKINKLRSLSSSSNANEAANAAAAANRLIDQYRLSEADLESVSEEEIVEDDRYLYETGRKTPWRNLLINVLIKHYGVACLLDVDRSSGRAVSKFKMIGRHSDMEIVKYMFVYLSTECERLSASEVKGTGRVSVASYQEGFVVGIRVQLQNSREELKHTASPNSIIKIDSRFENSKKKMYEMFSGIRSSNIKSQRQVNANAFHAGKEKGQSMHLGASMNAASGIKMLNK